MSFCECARVAGPLITCSYNILVEVLDLYIMPSSASSSKSSNSSRSKSRGTHNGTNQSEDSSQRNASLRDSDSEGNGSRENTHSPVSASNSEGEQSSTALDDGVSSASKGEAVTSSNDSDSENSSSPSDSHSEQHVSDDHNDLPELGEDSSDEDDSDKDMERDSSGDEIRAQSSRSSKSEDGRQGSDQSDRSRSSSNAKSNASSSSDSKSQPSSCSESNSQKVDPAHFKIQTILETNEEHMKRHDFPSFVGLCARCTYLKHKQAFEEQCTFEDGRTLQKFTYLYDTPNPRRKPWGVGCTICAWAGKNNKFGRCEVVALDTLRSVTHLKRHGNLLIKQQDGREPRNLDHDDAYARWLGEMGGDIAQRKSVEASRSSTDKAASTARATSASNQDSHGVTRANGPHGVSCANGPHGLTCGIGYGHVLHVLAIMQQRGSPKKAAANLEVSRLCGADIPAGNDSRTVIKKVSECIGNRERRITGELVQAASCGRLGQDDKGDSRLVLGCCIIWRWPRTLPINDLPCGVVALGKEKHGPWLAIRLLGVGRLGLAEASEKGVRGDRAAEGLADETAQILKNICGREEAFEKSKNMWRCSISDSAPSELNVPELLRQKGFSNLMFDAGDVTHSFQTALKVAVAGDPVVVKMRSALITGKKPKASLSNLLKYSATFRERFEERQKEEHLALLSHLGWGPTRMSSQSKPWRRTAQRLLSLYDALADEAESNSATAADAERIINDTAGFCELMVAGMMADLTHEHALAKGETDVDNLDVVVIGPALRRFKSRVTLLFVEGLIMSASMKHTFTAEVIHFLKEGKTLRFRGRVAVFAYPASDDKAALFEPLQRVRVIAVNLLQALDAYVPITAWQRVFEAFTLPSPLSRNQNKISEVAIAQVKDWLRQIYETARWGVEEAFKEFERLLVAAETHYEEGCTIHQAWARASWDFPELELGREQVSLFLVFGGNTGTVERWLKSVAMQYTAERSKMLGCTVDDALQGELMAPPPNKIAQRVETTAGIVHTAPIGKYLPSILRAYHEVHKGRRWSKPLKPRRDKNVRRDVEKLNAARVQKGRPITEREILDRREVEMKALLASSKDKRNRMSAKSHFSVSVPPSDDSFVNAATEKVREKIAKKAKLIEQRYKAPHERPTAALEARPLKHAQTKERRWGVDSEPAQVRGRGKKVPTDIFAWTESSPTLRIDAPPISLLHRHGWKICRKVSNFCGSLPPAEKRIFIALRLVDGPLNKKSLLTACRLVGGIFTTLEWLRVAVDPRGGLLVPKCLAYTGASKKSLQIAFTEAWGHHESLKEVVEVVKAAAKESKLKVLSSVKAAKKALKKALKEKNKANGKKSKPWKTISILAVSATDAEEVRSNLKRKYKSLVTTCEDFLNKRSKLKKAPVVPGVWATMS